MLPPPTLPLPQKENMKRLVAAILLGAAKADFGAIALIENDSSMVVAVWLQDMLTGERFKINT